MTTKKNDTSWEKIKAGTKDVERLLGQRDYNGCMMKARQTLEFMVKLQMERAGLTPNGDLSVLIDTLYENKWISKATCEHYHKIRMIGNKAAHEGDVSAYNANQAHHLLSQELYTFANDYRNARRGQRRPVNRSTTASRSKKRSKKRYALQPYDLLKFAIPILGIIVLFSAIQLFKSSKDNGGETVAPKETITATIAETKAPTNTKEETTAALSEVPAENDNSTDPIYVTTSDLNVRSDPSTNNTRLGMIPTNTVIDYVGSYNDDWAIILYQGQEAYVSSQYIIEKTTE